MRILFTWSLLFLFIGTFIPFASAQKAVILNFDDDWKGQHLCKPILENKISLLSE